MTLGEGDKTLRILNFHITVALDKNVSCGCGQNVGEHYWEGLEDRYCKTDGKLSVSDEHIGADFSAAGDLAAPCN